MHARTHAHTHTHVSKNGHMPFIISAPLHSLSSTCEAHEGWPDLLDTIPTMNDAHTVTTVSPQCPPHPPLFIKLSACAMEILPSSLQMAPVFLVTSCIRSFTEDVCDWRRATSRMVSRQRSAMRRFSDLLVVQLYTHAISGKPNGTVQDHGAGTGSGGKMLCVGVHFFMFTPLYNLCEHDYIKTITLVPNTAPWLLTQHVDSSNRSMVSAHQLHSNHTQ